MSVHNHEMQVSEQKLFFCNVDYQRYDVTCDVNAINVMSAQVDIWTNKNLL